MQVELLRDHILWAKENSNEESRVGFFWCFASDYDACYAVFKKIFMDEKIEEIKSDECNIRRSAEGFFVNDPYGSHDFFTKDEVLTFLDLWEKAKEIIPNVIYAYPGHDAYIKGKNASPKFRTIFDKEGIQLDALWFYDLEKKRLMWILPENFFEQTKEELAKAIDTLNYVALCYCEFCNTIQRPFSEFQQQSEQNQRDTDNHFYEYGCIHASQEFVDQLNKELKLKRSEQKLL